MKTTITLLSFLICLSSLAQTSQSDTLKLYDAYCEASNPYEIDTTIFKYGNDTLYIRNIHNGICDANNYRAIMQSESDTLKIDIVNIYEGADCTGDCSMGYTIKILQSSFDSLNVKIQNKNFTVKKSDIIMSSGQKMLENFEIYPNPVHNNLRISGKGIKKVEIVNMNGSVLIRKFESVDNIDLSYLDAGVYIVLIYTNEYDLTKKIIKK